MFQRIEKPKDKPDRKPGFIKRLRARLNRSDSWLTYDLANLVPAGKIDEDFIEELETHLLMADVGVDATRQIVQDLNKRVARKELSDVEALLGALRDSMLEILTPCTEPLVIEPGRTPFVILVVGVNGAGKTTTIGKIARKFKNQGLSVMLAAGDTFRAAAVEQLQVWGERNDVPVIAQQTGADPAAVIYDALEAAKARDVDVLIADTAGRLHSQTNLMDELIKVVRVMGKLDSAAPHETLLVLDAGLGQNTLTQATQFNDAIGLSGIVITKLDGTAKGGILLALGRKLGIPIRYIGVGEQIDDLGVFDAEAFVDALLARPET